MKKRILIVCEGVKTMPALLSLAPSLGAEWDLLVCDNPLEALSIMASVTTDAVVAEMRLKGMTGVQLLSEVTTRYPKCQRFMLADFSDKQTIMKCVGTSHHYLAKPCEAKALKSALERAFALDLWLMTDQVKKLVSQMQKLPSLPTLYFQVVRELQSPMASLENVGTLISQDLVMTAKLLQLINSAIFGLRRQVSNPAEAVMYLGIETTKSLLLMAHTYSYFDSIKSADFSVDALWKHAMATGALTRAIAASEDSGDELIEEAFTAGLLHDIGKLVLAANVPDQYMPTVRDARQKQVQLWEAELETFGTTHGEIGACLLGVWGLPIPIIEALALHHYPSRFLSKSFSPLTAVHVANAWQHEQEPAGKPGPRPLVDLEYLKEIGLDHRLGVWRAACQLPPIVEAEEGAKAPEPTGIDTKAA